MVLGNTVNELVYKSIENDLWTRGVSTQMNKWVEFDLDNRVNQSINVVIFNLFSNVGWDSWI